MVGSVYWGDSVCCPGVCVRSGVCDWARVFFLAGVFIGESVFEPKILSYGVPQESVVGLILFFIYTITHVLLLDTHDVTYQFSMIRIVDILLIYHTFSKKKLSFLCYPAFHREDLMV